MVRAFWKTSGTRRAFQPVSGQLTVTSQNTTCFFEPARAGTGEEGKREGERERGREREEGEREEEGGGGARQDQTGRGRQAGGQGVGRRKSKREEKDESLYLGPPLCLPHFAWEAISQIPPLPRHPHANASPSVHQSCTKKNSNPTRQAARSGRLAANLKMH